MAKTPQFSTKLASLTALGAGAMALTAGKAEASIIYQPISLKAGWDSGYSSSQTTHLAGSASIAFFIGGGNNSYRGFRVVGASIFRTFNNTTAPRQAGGFETLGCGCGTLRLVNTGAVWSGPGFTSQPTLVGGRRWYIPFASTTPGNSSTPRSSTPTSSVIKQRVSPGTTAHTFGNVAFTNEYGLFRFQPTAASGYLYGWVELSLTMNLDAGVNPGDGPDVDVLAFAYDDSGAPIAAGDTGTGTGTPEPSSLAESGVAALLLGATGLRRWRKTRTTA